MTRAIPIRSRPAKAAAPAGPAFASVLDGAAAIRASNMRLRSLRMAVEDQAAAIRLPAPAPTGSNGR